MSGNHRHRQVLREAATYSNPPPVTAPRNKQELNNIEAKVVSPETDDALHDKNIAQCGVVNSRVRPHLQGKHVSIEILPNPPYPYHFLVPSPERERKC
jgi:hypothetical protein